MDYVNGTINFLSSIFGMFFSIIAIYNVLTFTCENQCKEYKKLLIFQFSGGFLSSITQLILKIQVFVIHEKQITKIRFCYLIIYATLCPILITISNWFCFIYDIPESLSQWVEASNIKYSIFRKKVYGISGKINSDEALPAYFSVPLYFGINYILVFVHYIKYKKHMQKFTTVMSDMTKKINKEFMRISILQCTVPLLVSFFPILYFIVSLFLLPQLFVATFGTHLIQILSFIPIANVTLFIFLPSKSRKKFICFLKKIKDKIICKNFTITKYR
uniref:G_PROTEIN_RECEP_F1_2 domain-containing protein n=1 Tax=Strongyloides venezuelensis TaxID=75913 RepID=A0A0K0F3P3_STRVS